MKTFKKHKKNIFIYMLLSISLWACQEVYTPDIENKSGALVVEGMLLDTDEQLKVKISRTVSFNDATIFEGESNAIVQLRSDNNQQWNLFEINAGYYQTWQDVKTQAGIGYYLYIQTTDGEEYTSDVEIMPDYNEIANVTFKDTINEEVNYNSYGQPFVKSYDGISFSVMPGFTTANVGYLYRWSLLINTTVLVKNGYMFYNYYCWRTLNSKDIYVYDYNNAESGNELALDDLLFMSYYSMLLLGGAESEIKGQIDHIETSGLYYLIRQYTTTKQGSEFWKGIQKQSEANGKLFDPLEEEIITNMCCTSNPDIECYGYFNTASYSQRIIGAYIWSREIVTYGDVDTFPSPEKTPACIMDNKPDFWF